MRFVHGFPRGLRAPAAVSGKSPVERAQKFLATHRELYRQTDPALALVVRRAKESPDQSDDVRVWIEDDHGGSLTPIRGGHAREELSFRPAGGRRYLLVLAAPADGVTETFALQLRSVKAK